MTGTNVDVEGYLQRVEAENGKIESVMAQARLQCKHHRRQIRDIYLEAKDNGVEVRPLKGLVKHRQLDKANQMGKAKIVATLDDDEYAIYRGLVEQLGPLGEAALRAHGLEFVGVDASPGGDGAAQPVSQPRAVY